MTDSLSFEQKHAFEKFKKGENLFITGPGGTGKTKLIHTFVRYMEDNGISYQVCAMTGCAAVLLGCKAKTLHSWAGIKLAKGQNDVIIRQVLKCKLVITTWRKTKVLIVDEVSMMSKKIFELCEKLSRIIRKNEKPFGGMQVIFTGDFYQLPPVGSVDDDTSKFAFESDKWFQLFPLENNIQLHTIFRQTDKDYIKILLEIRKGEISEEGKQILYKYVKRPCNTTETNGIIPTKLFPVKSKVEYVNSAMFSKIENDIVLFERFEKKNMRSYIDSGKIIEPDIILKCSMLSPEDIVYELESISKNINTDNPIQLKIGALVMCTYNFDVENGICNGSQGTVVDFKEMENTLNGEAILLENKKMPVVLFSNGQKRIIPYVYHQHEDYPVLAVGQLPLCLAWALTIHKIQGATLDMADMDLGKSIFEFGQSYVALSRVRSLNGLYISEFYPHRIKANPLVKEFYSKLPVIHTTNQPVVNNELEEEEISDEDDEQKDEEQEEIIEEKKNIFESFKFKLECPICMSNYNTIDKKPVTIPCGHTFCISHLSQIDHCPCCREEIKMKSNIKPNYSIMGMLDPIEKKDPTIKVVKL